MSIKVYNIFLAIIKVCYYYFCLIMNFNNSFCALKAIEVISLFTVNDLKFLFHILWDVQCIP